MYPSSPGPRHACMLSPEDYRFRRTSSTRLLVCKLQHKGFKGPILTYQKYIHANPLDSPRVKTTWMPVVISMYFRTSTPNITMFLAQDIDKTVIDPKRGPKGLVVYVTTNLLEACALAGFGQQVSMWYKEMLLSQDMCRMSRNTSLNATQTTNNSTGKKPTARFSQIRFKGWFSCPTTSSSSSLSLMNPRCTVCAGQPLCLVISV